MKVKSGSPLDPMRPAQFRDSLPVLLKPLCQVINASFTTAVVPLPWKQARVIPLLKKPSLDPIKPENFRPISLLPWVAKIAEAHTNNILSGFLNDTGAPDGSQNGFRPGHSTETALLAVGEHLRTILDEGQRAALILLDLSAAFDTVSHQILLRRLEEAGVVGLALDWFQSFLSDRAFQVTAPSFSPVPIPSSRGSPGFGTQPCSV